MRARAVAATTGTILKNVDVDRGRGHVSMAEELLHGANVVTAHQQVGGKGIAESVQVIRLSRPASPDAEMNDQARVKPQDQPRV